MLFPLLDGRDPSTRGTRLINFLASSDEIRFGATCVCRSCETTRIDRKTTLVLNFTTALCSNRA
jgi:hypothetical protein